MSNSFWEPFLFHTAMQKENDKLNLGFFLRFHLKGIEKVLKHLSHFWYPYLLEHDHQISEETAV